ncbi:hypothetical protein ACLB2K_040660 [Fragaria x ananassa]
MLRGRVERAAPTDGRSPSRTAKAKANLCKTSSDMSCHNGDVAGEGRDMQRIDRFLSRHRLQQSLRRQTSRWLRHM